MIKCTECKSTKINKRVDIDKSGNRTALYICQSCGHEMEAE